MKKLIAIVSLLVVVATLLAGCSFRLEINPEKAQSEKVQVG